MLRHRTALLSTVAVAALTFSACSDDDREELENDIGTLVDEVEDAARTAASEVEEAAGEAASDVAEVAVRNIATEQGEEQFTDSGNALDENGLSCEATANDGLDAVDVNCTGTTEDGGAAEMTGATSEMPGASVSELEGTFTGTVDGAEVFSVTTLGG